MGLLRRPRLFNVALTDHPVVIRGGETVRNASKAMRWLCTAALTLGIGGFPLVGAADITISSGAGVTDWWTYETITYSNQDVGELSPASGQTVTYLSQIHDAQMVGAVKGPITSSGSEPADWSNWGGGTEGGGDDCSSSAHIGVALRP